MPANAVLQLVSFQLGEESFAVLITKVQEIIRMTHMVKIPKSFDFVEGLINLRGKIIPVIDVRKRFGMESSPQGAQCRIIVAELGGVTAGLQVDAVGEVVRVESSLFEETPSFISSVDQKFISGIVHQGEKMLIVLDLEKLLSHDETRLLKEAT